MAFAVIASGTVDIPTTAAPSMRAIRISAGVSKEGPEKAKYTPLRTEMRSSIAAFSNAAENSGS